MIKKIFPIPYKEEIIKYSTIYGVDPDLVAAIIKTESNFDPYAISRKEARGLMQISPITGKWAAKELKRKNFYLEELFVTDINIQMGCWYVQKLNQQFDGDIRLILAAYNGGSGNVSKWLMDKRYSTNGEQLEYIPFPETRNYVEKVLFYHKLYKRIHHLSEML